MYQKNPTKIQIQVYHISHKFHKIQLEVGHKNLTEIQFEVLSKFFVEESKVFRSQQNGINCTHF